MAKRPSELDALLDSLASQLPKLLGRDLVGIYVYGSLTQGSFQAERSDVDVMVAVRRDVSDAQFRRLGEWLEGQAAENEWTTRLQMMIIGWRDIFTMDARAVHYQFGKLRRDGSDGNPIPWINILESGITLYGPPAKEFVPEITPDMIYDTMVRELGYLSEELNNTPNSAWRDSTKYRAYAVLTVCRILYTLRKGKIVSKPRAAIWALRTLPDEWHSLISAAVAHDAGQTAKLLAARDKKICPVCSGVLRAEQCPQRSIHNNQEKLRNRFILPLTGDAAGVCLALWTSLNTRTSTTRSLTLPLWKSVEAAGSGGL